MSDLPKVPVVHVFDENNPPFQKNEDVLAYHGALIYGAKVLDLEFKKRETPRSGSKNVPEWHTYMHYKVC